ncbi:zinc-dependent metalloprotease family protein [Idiomarina sp. Sol25]|uniref:zinc-dependent metalloprotease family protein n=1 Tax=Idiomarina sp. Sol25 TaxID=3064000 RepID=UPI00294AA9D7|nr:zinc-dependent metalloprotease family protein [Idiomarina sp. Sol25]MDV6328445.1 zinc-dependent metalloprotease family protein [Idiomarina sp. Sol25]
MKKTVAAVLIALAPVFALAQSLGDKIELSVNNQLIEATLAERLSSGNSYRLTYEDRYGDTQHLGFLHKRGDNQLISITHPQLGSVSIRRVDGETFVEDTGLPPVEPKAPRVDAPKAASLNVRALPQKAYFVNKSAAPASETQSFDSSLDVLFVYDERLLGYAEQNGYDLELAIQSAVDASNSIFQRSGLAVTMAVAGLERFRPESTTNFPNEAPDSLLDELINDKRITRMVDRYKADVVHFIGADNPSLCGIAFRAVQFNPSDNRVNYVSGGANAGYTSLSCMGNGTVAHEIGHNFGLKHDRYTLADNSSGGGGEQFDNHIPYGFIEEQGRFYTTMSYDSVCRKKFSSGDCVSEAAYSSPDLVDRNYGLPLGRAAVEIDAANASLAAQRSSIIWTNNSSRTNVAGMRAERTGDDRLALSWPRVEDAERYVIYSGQCELYESIDQQNLMDTATTQNIFNNAISYAASSLPSSLCVIALDNINPDTVRWRFVSNASFSGDYTDATGNYLLLNNNVLSLVETGDQAAVTIDLSDSDTANNAIQLALPVTASGTDVSQQVGIDNAAEWFNWTVSGAGNTRTMTVTLKQSLVDISSGLGKDNVHNPYHLPLRVVNTDAPGFSVSSGLWIEPARVISGTAQVFISEGESVAEVTILNAAISVYNVPGDVVISVSDTEGLISGFSAVEVGSAVEGERRIQMTGETPVVDEALSVPLRVDFSDGSESITVSLTVEPRAIAPSISGFTATGTTEGGTVRLSATVTDADLNLDPGSLRLFRVMDSGEEEVTGFGFNDGAFSASLGQLSAGTYQYRLSVSDTEGNTQSATARFTVTAADSGSSGGHAGWLVVLGLVALGLRRRTAH